MASASMESDDYTEDMEDIAVAEDNSQALRKPLVIMPNRGRHVSNQRRRVTLEQKQAICRYKLDNPKAFSREIFLHFRKLWPAVVAPSTISKILSNSDRWLAQDPRNQESQKGSKTRVYTPRHSRLETALYLWYLSFKDKVKVTNDMLKSKAMELAHELNLRKFHCSNKWMYSFKKRHGILKFKCKVKEGQKVLSIDLDYAYDAADSSQDVGGNKVNFIMDDAGDGTIHVTAPLSLEEAKLGLMNTMGYLAAHPAIARNYIDILWDIFQQILKPAEVMDEDVYGEMDGRGDETNNEESMDESQYYEMQAAEKSIESESVAQMMEQLQHATPVSVVDPPDDTKDGTTLSIQSDSNQVQYAVQGANGEYILVLAETEHGEDVDLAKTLPDILSAAGHKAEDGTQFIETVDPDTGLRTISIAGQDGTVPDSITTETPNEEVTGQPMETVEALVDGSLPDVIKDNQTETEKLSAVVIAQMSASITRETNEKRIAKIMSPLKVTMGDQTYDLIPIDENGKEMHGLKKIVDHATNEAAQETSTETEGNTSDKKMSTDEGRNDSSLNDVEAESNLNESSKKNVKSIIEPFTEGRESYQCNVCDKVYKRHTCYLSHMAHHSGNCPCYECKTKKKKSSATKEEEVDRKPQVCQTCGQCFTSAKELAEHNQIHLDQDFICEKCGEVFYSAAKLRKHSQEHVDMECKECGDCFPSPYALKLHMKSHPSTLKYCQVCDKWFVNKSNLNKHMRLHTGEMDYVCHHCNAHFQDASSFKEHRLIHSIKANSYHCEECSQIFTTKRNLENHISQEHGDGTTRSSENNHSCLICKKSFNTEQSLNVHMLLGHPKGKSRQSLGKEEHACKKCGKSFNTSGSLNMHMKSHVKAATDEFACDDCERVFTTGAALHAHKVKSHAMKTRTPTASSSTDSMERKETKLSIECQLCAEVFDNESSLEAHKLKLHTKKTRNTDTSDNMECLKCAKKYTDAEEFQDHMKDHLMESLHECSICKELFKTSKALKNHVLSHDDNKTPLQIYTCETCGQVFNAELQLFKHLKEHKIKQEPVHECDVCGKNMPNANALTKHMKTHKDDNAPYRCPICDEGFKFPNSIRRHMRSEHPNS